MFNYIIEQFMKYVNLQKFFKNVLIIFFKNVSSYWLFYQLYKFNLIIINFKTNKLVCNHHRLQDN